MKRSTRFSIWRAILVALVVLALCVAVWRLAKGLGATTALSDKFPWGLWIGFDVLSGVALAAGGFTMAATVYILNLKRYYPLVRPAILTAFLGYLLVIFGLLLDLGRPYRIWHPMVMWQPHSVMFEVAWCVMLYTTVLALEFSPVFFEGIGRSRAARVVRSVTIPLVIAGVILSTLHQSSLGSLYLIVPTKLHPLWYSPLLPVFFYVSAIAVGFAMVTVESYLSSKAFKKSLETPLLSSLGKAAMWVLIIYLIMKVVDLGVRGSLFLIFDGTIEGLMFLLEMIVGVIIPVLLLASPTVRRTAKGLFVSSLLVVIGVVFNRFNVAFTGMVASTGGRYFPSWMEFAVTVGLVSAGILAYVYAVEYLPVFPEERKERYSV